MENKFFFVEFENQIGSALKFYFDQNLINDLIENDGWIKLKRDTSDNKKQYFIFPLQIGVIRSINWIT